MIAAAHSRTVAIHDGTFLPDIAGGRHCCAARGRGLHHRAVIDGIAAIIRP